MDDFLNTDKWNNFYVSYVARCIPETRVYEKHEIKIETYCVIDSVPRRIESLSEREQNDFT